MQELRQLPSGMIGRVRVLFHKDSLPFRNHHLEFVALESLSALSGHHFHRVMLWSPTCRWRGGKTRSDHHGADRENTNNRQKLA
jgi:hypothetical protein